MISSLTSLASLGLLPRIGLWDVFFAVRGFLCHSNSWIRQGDSQSPFFRFIADIHKGTAGFVAAAARNLPPSDVWCILYPSVRTMLHADVLELDDDSIMAALVAPVSDFFNVPAHKGRFPERPWWLPRLLLFTTLRLGFGHFHLKKRMGRKHRLTLPPRSIPPSRKSSKSVTAIDIMSKACSVTKAYRRKMRGRLLH